MKTIKTTTLALALALAAAVGTLSLAATPASAKGFHGGGVNGGPHRGGVRGGDKVGGKLGPRPLGSPPPLWLGLRLRDRRLRRRLLPRPPLRRADQGLRVTRRPHRRRRLETQGFARAPQAQHQAPHDRPLSRRRSTAARQGLTFPP